MKAQMHSVEMQLQSSISLMKIQGTITKSAEIMKAMNKLMSVPSIQKTMSEMAVEMERMGLIEEVMGEALDSLDVVIIFSQYFPSGISSS